MLKDCEWSLDRDYKTGSENEPLQFYLDGLANSTEFSLLLGYFSSSAINLLSVGFATFISKGGKMRMVINHLLSEKDKYAIGRVEEAPNEIKVFDLTDIVSLERVLDEYNTHFFECLAYLIAEKRIEIKIIKPKKGKGIAHYKSGIFSDGQDSVGYHASCNFTYYGLSENIEQLEAFLSWENSRSTKLIKNQVKLINNYFEETDEDVEYVSTKDIEVVLRDRFGKKDIDELLVREEQLLKKKQSMIANPRLKNSISKIFQNIEEYRNSPRFPYPSGPRDYQKEARESWILNKRKGMFAMATGTGKTITALNCALEDYKNDGYYKILILVPTTSLANQWHEEAVNNFNFNDTLVCCSINSTWKQTIKSIGRNILYGLNPNYCLITTYATFKGDVFQNTLFHYFKPDFEKIILIADEAHTMGSTGFHKKLPEYLIKRIGLSATPERQFDLYGNKLLAGFFSTSEQKYTYEYNMKVAIENDFLCRYYYHPVIVSLSSLELEKYIKISKQLLRYFDFEKGEYLDEEFVKMLLIKRKKIIHKAEGKLDAIVNIVKEIKPENFTNAFIYVPEGVDLEFSEQDELNDNDNEATHKLIDIYTKLLYENFGLKISKFTSETKDRDLILSNFKSQKLDALVAMKCLDEGVDIPQAKYAIFCSSSGNPRQYVQRRGRVLRKHTSKQHAVIYDLIVKPPFNFTNQDEKTINMEKNIFLSEMKRLVNFAVLSENSEECLNNLSTLCYDFGIDIYQLANEELNNYE